MFHQVLQAIMPRLTMECVIDNWGEIADRLASPWRKRRGQIEAIMGKGLASDKKAIHSDKLK